MNINIDGKAVEEFKKILELPPYLIFTFIGAIFVIASVIWNNNFYSVWIFFLYSIIGAIFRYIEKDLLRECKKWEERCTTEKNNIKKDRIIKLKEFIIIIYHVLNLGLMATLIYYLKLI